MNMKVSLWVFSKGSAGGYKQLATKKIVGNKFVEFTDEEK